MKKLSFILLYSYIITSPLYSQWTDAYIPDFKVNDDPGTALQSDSRIGVDSAGNFVVVWDDSRNYQGQYPYHIFCQIFLKDGIRVGNNFRVGQDTVSGPEISVLKDGRFIVVWYKILNGSGDHDLYFQRFNKSGQPLGSWSKVNDSIIFFGGGGLSIDVDSSGKFVISFSARFGLGYSKVYFQRYDSSGNRIGSLQVVNEANSRSQQPDIAVNDDGSFVICWQDDRYSIQLGQDDIFMQRYNNNGVKIGNNVKVNEGTDTLKEESLPKISSDKKGNFVITWTDRRFSPFVPMDIFYQMYDSNGIPIGPNKKANEISGEPMGNNRVSMRKDRYFYIGWVDFNYSGRYQFYGRRFEPSGNPYGIPSSPYMIPMSSPPPSQQSSSGVYLLGDRVYAGWTDDRNGNADIYCNVRGFQNPDTTLGIKKINEIAKDFKLFPPYPNPFNSSSLVKFQAAKTGRVILKIFDICGREVRVLVNDVLMPGRYEVIFSGYELSSGLYFVELRTEDGYRETRKIVLIK